MNKIDEDEKELLDEEVELDEDELEDIEVPEEEEELEAIPDLFLKDVLEEEEEEDLDDEYIDFDLFDDIDE
jgi:hypothetical protein